MAGDQFGDQFGANEWLVDEMYERYLQDPNSVEAAWVALFATTKPTAPPTPSGASSGAPRGGVPPIPKSAQSAQSAVVIPLATPVALTAAAQPIVPQEVVRPSPIASAPTPADPVVKPVPVLATPSAAAVENLRGVAGRVVQSMEASLSVPTATSVRVIPAKLLIDNRIVINNHLKRARGGKVSFTHLIAYAMIKALRAMPEMNSFYTQLDGKPAVAYSPVTKK